MTRWVVDGMNVIGSRPTGWWRNRPGAMRDLAAELERFGAATGESVTVVFDGGPVEIEPGERLDVRFASRRGAGAADDDIAALVERDGDPVSLSVVTSDADLARRVRALGASVVGSGEFRRRLDG